jgi:hypothetical protein
MSYNSNFGFSERGLHADAQSWYTRVIANGGTVNNKTLRAVDEFCRGVNGNGVNSISGVRSFIKSLNLFCGNNIAAAQVPLIADSGSTVWAKTGTVNFQNTGPNRGITGDGATGYLNTGVDDTVFTGGNGAVVAFVPSSWALVASKSLVGADNTVIGSASTTQVSYGLRFFWGWNIASPRPLGCYAVVGVSGTNATGFLVDGAQVDAIGGAQVAATGRAMYVCARNNAGAAAEFSSVPIAAVAILDGTSDAIWRTGTPNYTSILGTLNTAFRAFHSKLGW